MLHGIAVENATRGALDVEVVRANRHLQDALAADIVPDIEPEEEGADTIAVRFDKRTRMMAVGSRRRASYRALRKGDRVTVIWVARRRVAAEDLPRARTMVDRDLSPRPRASRRGPSGAAFTTNHDGTAVNLNHYASPDDVYLNGGPSCGAPRHAAALPDGAYHFKVTTPNGRKLLSTSSLADRRFVMRDGRLVSATAPTNELGCDEDGLVVKVAPFTVSPNGVYKLWIAPVKAFADDESRWTKRSKTDNFKIEPGDDEPNPDPGPGPDPDPDPSL